MVENNGNPYEQMDDLGGKNPPLFLEGHPYAKFNCFLVGFGFIDPGEDLLDIFSTFL